MFLFSRRFLLFLSIFISLSSCATGDDSLREGNNHFRKYYKSIKENILKSCGPIIVYKGDELVLYHKGEREVASYMPGLYHRYKEIDHIPMILEILSKHLPKKEYDEVIDHFEKLVLSIEKNIGTYQFPKKEIPTQMQILARTKKLINEIQEGRKTKKTCFAEYCRDITPLLLKNVEKAAALQLRSLHKQVKEWKEKISKEDWLKLNVLVIGPQAPRVGEVSVQYFHKVHGLKTPERIFTPNKIEGPKLDIQTQMKGLLLYAENLWKEEQALDLLATRLLDQQIGKMFFNDPEVMARDVLSDSAFKFLKEKCKKDWKCYK